MPIRPENKARYPKDWKAIADGIRERAGQKCERCKAPNHETIARGDDGTYMLMGGEVHDAETGEYLGMAKGSEYPCKRFTYVVLTVAHLDHTPENCDPSNLKAMCQRCHLNYDKHHHAQTAYATRKARAKTDDMFSQESIR